MVPVLAYGQADGYNRTWTARLRLGFLLRSAFQDWASSWGQIGNCVPFPCEMPRSFSYCLLSRPKVKGRSGRCAVCQTKVQRCLKVTGPVVTWSRGHKTATGCEGRLSSMTPHVTHGSSLLVVIAGHVTQLSHNPGVNEMI